MPTIKRSKGGDAVTDLVLDVFGLNGQLLTAGDRLEIPGRGASGSSGSSSANESTRMTYKVRSGDTLSEIAEKFNVSVRQLMTWNQLRQSTSLRAGQRLVVYVDPRRINGG